LNENFLVLFFKKEQKALPFEKRSKNFLGVFGQGPCRIGATEHARGRTECGIP
jgi:hypothetical protein